MAALTMALLTYCGDRSTSHGWLCSLTVALAILTMAALTMALLTVALAPLTMAVLSLEQRSGKKIAGLPRAVRAQVNNDTPEPSP